MAPRDHGNASSVQTDIDLGDVSSQDGSSSISSLSTVDSTGPVEDDIDLGNLTGTNWVGRPRPIAPANDDRHIREWRSTVRVDELPPEGSVSNGSSTSGSWDAIGQEYPGGDSSSTASVVDTRVWDESVPASPLSAPSMVANADGQEEGGGAFPSYVPYAGQEPYQHLPDDAPSPSFSDTPSERLGQSEQWGNESDVTAEEYFVPDAAAGANVLPCEFAFIGNCARFFQLQEENSWMGHIESHMNKKIPSVCKCWFCEEYFDAEEMADEVADAAREQKKSLMHRRDKKHRSSANPGIDKGALRKANFEDRLHHISDHFRYTGATFDGAAPDMSLIEYLHRHRIISDSRYKQIRFPARSYQEREGGERQRQQKPGSSSRDGGKDKSKKGSGDKKDGHGRKK